MTHSKFRDSVTTLWCPLHRLLHPSRTLRSKGKSSVDSIDYLVLQSTFLAYTLMAVIVPVSAVSRTFRISDLNRLFKSIYCVYMFQRIGVSVQNQANGGAATNMCSLLWIRQRPGGSKEREHWSKSS